MSGRNKKPLPRGRAANPNPLRDIRHADGFHARVVDTSKSRVEDFTSLDDLCMGCWELLADCNCDYDEGLDDG